MAGFTPVVWWTSAVAPPLLALIQQQEAPSTLPEQVVDQEAASSQGLLSYSSLGQFGQTGTAGQNWLTANTLMGNAAAYSTLAALGLSGPTYGLTPMNMALNAQYAQLVNATANQINQSNVALSLIGTGSAALLAGAGRQFLANTYGT